MSKRKTYKLVSQRPAAKFYYQGSHSHPVRRTVLVIENRPNVIVGYELREGNETRTGAKAPIKSYRKSEIARYGDYSRIRTPKNKRRTQSTLARSNLLSLLQEGV